MLAGDDNGVFGVEVVDDFRSRFSSRATRKTFFALKENIVAALHQFSLSTLAPNFFHKRRAEILPRVWIERASDSQKLFSATP